MEEEDTRKTGLVIGALVLAAIAVVGVVVWLTGSWPAQELEDEPQQIAVDIVENPTPTPDSARISPEAAISTESSPAPDVAGVSVMTETGPAENILLAAGLLSLLGFSGSVFLARKFT